MKFTLKVKLFGSFLIVLLMMGVVAYLGLDLGDKMNECVEDLGNNRLSKAVLVGEANGLMPDIRRYQIMYVQYSMEGNQTKVNDYGQIIDGFRKEMTEIIGQFEEQFTSVEGKKLVQDFVGSYNQYTALGGKLRDLLAEGKYAEAKRVLEVDALESYRGADNALKDLIQFNSSQAEKALSDAENMYNQTRNFTLIIVFGAIIISLAIAILLTVSITKVVNQMLNMLKDMAESGGDLTKRIQVSTQDEIGELAQWFNAFLDKLHDIISQVKQTANMVSTAANETSLGNQDLSQRTEEQASSLEEISSTIEEVNSSLQKSSESATDADKSSRATMDTVRKGETVVNELHGAMEEITQGSHEIAEIIAKVNDIAFQTNLLALNAAVEAARAGEQGRGFAVVAAEVRNLAGRTAESAKEIESLIKQSIGKVERGNGLMEQTASVLGEIVDNTQKTTDIMTEIASSMREQTTAADDIRTAVEQLNQVTQQNASLVEEIAGSSESVSNEAEELSALVGKFKVNEILSGFGREANHSFAASNGYNGSASRPSQNSKPAKSAKMPKPQVKKHTEFDEADFEKF